MENVQSNSEVYENALSSESFEAELDSNYLHLKPGSKREVLWQKNDFLLSGYMALYDDDAKVC